MLKHTVNEETVWKRECLTSKVTGLNMVNH